MKNKKTKSLFWSLLAVLILSFLVGWIVFFGLRFYLDEAEKNYWKNWEKTKQKKNKIVTAIHESGHILLINHYPDDYLLVEATIQAKNKKAGYVNYQEKELTNPLLQRERDLQSLMISLSGYKAVDLVLGDKNFFQLNHLNPNSYQNDDSDINKAMILVRKIAQTDDSNQTPEEILTFYYQKTEAILTKKKHFLIWFASQFLEDKDQILTSEEIKSLLDQQFSFSSDNHFVSSLVADFPLFDFYHPLFRKEEMIAIAILSSGIIFLIALIIRNLVKK